MSEDAHYSDNFERNQEDLNPTFWQDALARVNAHVVQPARYSEWVEDQITAELTDQFFLHEMGIAECDFHEDRIIVYQTLLPERTGGR